MNIAAITAPLRDGDAILHNAPLSGAPAPACSIDLIIDDIRDGLRGRPLKLVSVAGGWLHRTRKVFCDAIWTARGIVRAPVKPLSQTESLILLCIADFQPITRGQLGEFFGKEVSRDTIGHLRDLGFIAAGPRSRARCNLHRCDDEGFPLTFRLRDAAGPP